MNLAALYGQFITAGDLVFDIGAHRGDLAAVFLECGARVVAVEPLPEMAARLRERFAGRGVTVVEAAAGAVAGAATLHWRDGFTGLATLYPETWYAAGTRFQAIAPDHNAVVAVTTLDALIAAHGRPAFVKVDVEGGELAVLQGLSRAVPALCFEYACEHLPAAWACCIRLAALGYRDFTCTAREGPDLCVPWGPAAGVLSYATARHPSEWGNIFVRLEEP